ncbi:MAG: hypothetical protein GY772_20325 [bacterium]|nr:hypothetical protein [bacterium]
MSSKPTVRSLLFLLAGRGTAGQKDSRTALCEAAGGECVTARATVYGLHCECLWRAYPDGYRPAVQPGEG